MQRIHFIFSGTQNAIGGGTTLWKTILADVPFPVFLHYSSFARNIWENQTHPLVSHIIHKEWRTYENKTKPLWKESAAFNKESISAGDIVLFDSMEAIRQLALPLSQRGATLLWHMQSKEHLLRKNISLIPWDFACYQKLHGILAISEFVKKRFESDPLYRLASKKIPITILLNPINSRFQPIKAEHNFILYFGRYESYKNPLFLESLPYDVRYIGSTKGCSKPVAVPPNKDLGWLPPEEAARYGDIVIFPAMGEAFGLALVEMMSYGKIVIAFESGAFPEIIKHGWDGFLVKPFDRASVIAIIEHLRANPTLRENIIQNALDKAKRFAPQPYRKKFFETLASFPPSR